MKNLIVLGWYHKCYYLIIQVWSNLGCFDSPIFLEMTYNLEWRGMILLSREY